MKIGCVYFHCHLWPARGCLFVTAKIQQKKNYTKHFSKHRQQVDTSLADALQHLLLLQETNTDLDLERHRIWNLLLDPHLCSCQPGLLVRFRLFVQMFNIPEWKQLSPAHTQKTQQKAITNKTSSGKENKMPSWTFASHSALTPLSFHKLSHKHFLFSV